MRVEHQYSVIKIMAELVAKEHDKRQLEVYEQLWINKLKSINTAPVIELLLNEARKQTQKKYYINNKEKERIRQQEFVKKHKERFSIPTNCECGGRYTYKNKSCHFKSKKHLDFLLLATEE
ncbi:MAG: hypothetical protein HGA35_03795 [Erysipelotrichaceae bacterium]|nr:hypothetical protein [Erysipelotrichaceae bacterium]